MKSLLMPDWPVWAWQTVITLLYVDNNKRESAVSGELVPDCDVFESLLLIG